MMSTAPADVQCRCGRTSCRHDITARDASLVVRRLPGARGERQLLAGRRGAPHDATRVQPAHPCARGMARRRAGRPRGAAFDVDRGRQLVRRHGARPGRARGAPAGRCPRRARRPCRDAALRVDPCVVADLRADVAALARGPHSGRADRTDVRRAAALRGQHARAARRLPPLSCASAGAGSSRSTLPVHRHRPRCAAAGRGAGSGREARLAPQLPARGGRDEGRADPRVQRRVRARAGSSARCADRRSRRPAAAWSSPRTLRPCSGPWPSRVAASHGCRRA